MIYTVPIDTKNIQALSIIDMLKALAVDYDFLKIEAIEQSKTDLTVEQEEELDSRYEYVIKNPTVGKPWSEVKQNLLSK